MIDGEFSAGIIDSKFAQSRKKYFIEKQHSGLTPLVNHSLEDSHIKRHPTVITRTDFEVYNMVTESRESDKQLVLPSIIKSPEDTMYSHEDNKEYRDVYEYRGKKPMSSKSSLRSIINSTKKVSKKTKSKSQ